MADLTFFQKYPKAGEDESGAKSMRIDHPDFGDVLRTTYAKGVITDFEKVADDPIEVKSRVKVEIEGYGESEYLPLFFHPKALYWDGPDEIKATDFNVEGKYFEKAWMSFRGGDEVAVLMRATESDPELKPFAVLSFADGVPRIGENIVKFECPWLGAGGTYTEYFSAYPPSAPIPYPDEDLGPDGIDLKLLIESELIFNETGNFWYFFKCDDDAACCTVRVTEHLFVVGPLLFLVQAMSWYCPDTYYPELYYTLGIKTQVGIYTPELYNSVKSGPTAYHSPTEFYTLDFPGGLIPGSEWWNLYDGLTIYPFFLSSVAASGTSGFDWSNAKFYVRPHTKEELIAAGMWPYEESA